MMPFLSFLELDKWTAVWKGASRFIQTSKFLLLCFTENNKAIGVWNDMRISKVDFKDSVLVLGFSEELNELLLQLYLENRKEIRQILSKLAPSLPHYHNLEWRLDVQLASRTLRHQVKPTVTMKLHLEDKGQRSARVLQTDPATLQHLIQELERALAELKSNHCRRILRNIK
ncbi:COMM domain-containing protein 2-like isoform X2 [Myxocyprinus asiaticus]|uniref:COMM domain-containing protein 2-like isoform X2 n=1 Tax=Myxocyprinus asiaticus TaxID=70543 RepID=UPI002223CDCD|nr:COMM domain-containing protein 2-like isoform X2 [Myxocyprinus asiaticus]